MAIGFSFEAYLLFGTLALFLLIGVFLRAKVGFFQRFLIPGCLIGGAIAMVLRNSGIIPMDTSLLEEFVYQLFNVSFIALGLTPSPERKESEEGEKKRIKAPVGMGLIEGVIFPLQIIVGGLLTMLFINLNFNLFNTFGFLSPLGFIEGPGQALSIGSTWETVAGFTSASTVGLTFATLGFVFAFFVGVPLVNWGIRNGLSAYAPKKLPEAFRRGITSKDEEKEVGGRLTTHSANIDSLAFQAALIGSIFILTYGLVGFLSTVLPPGLSETLWGFFFFFGLANALLVRQLMGVIGIDYLLDRELQKRISGWAVDFLIVATVTAIQLAIVLKFIIPILTIALVTGGLTLLVVFYLGKRVWSNYNLERTAGIFGTVTGTVPTGLLLIRIADPDFRTPAAIDLGVMLIFAAPFIVTSMILVNAPVLMGWSIPFTLLIFAGMMAIPLALLKILGLLGKPQF